jgi:hypothetical protein
MDPSSWHRSDPLRAAICYHRVERALLLINECLPDWALDAHDCGGQTLLMRAVSSTHSESSMIRIVKALLQRAPHLDIRVQSIKLNPNETVQDALLRPDLIFGGDAFTCIAAHNAAAADPSSPPDLVSPLLIQTARTCGSLLRASSVLIWTILHPSPPPTLLTRVTNTPEPIPRIILAREIVNLICVYAKLNSPADPSLTPTPAPNATLGTNVALSPFIASAST